ncbi:MAG: hypothetical protein KHZ58_14905 [Hungatella hathewayi]|nr:hypothetical protein [Hungatella hathewayi]
MIEGRAERRSRRSRANLAVVVMAAVFCIGVLGGAGYMVSRYTNRPPEVQYPQLEPEGNVRSGTLSDPAGRQAELDAIVEEGMLTFSINATPVMKDGKSAANLLIENPPSNGNRFTVTISREDTGETIYRSGYLDPEQYIEEARLETELPAGEYSCLANFDAYRISDNAYIGRAAARLTLYVQK